MAEREATFYMATEDEVVVEAECEVVDIDKSDYDTNAPVIACIDYFFDDMQDEIEAWDLSGDVVDRYVIFDDDDDEMRYTCSDVRNLDSAEDIYGNGIVQY